ncbi:hypothetical protein STFR1_50416 [Bacillus vallismortis]
MIRAEDPDFFVSFVQALSGFHSLKVMIQYTNVSQLQSIVGVDMDLT